MSLPTHDHINQFRDAIARQFGLHFDDGKRVFLSEVLAKQLSDSNAIQYIQRLLSGQTTHDEIAKLAEELTVGETYFFRHSDQFRAFTDAVVARRESLRRLHVLSAGCASGEEAYSLAITLRESIPDLSSWDVRIVGIDLNPSALAKAARARYTHWSLRGLPEDARVRFFHTSGKEYQLDSAIRAMVSFEERNLLQESLDFWRPGAFDVIFCRNVLMYFTPEATREVVSRFTRALTPSGFLFLGPAETLRGISHDYHLRHTHDAFHYQRRTESDATHTQSMDYASPVPNAGDVSWVTAIGQASDRIARLSRETPSASPNLVKRPVPEVKAPIGTRDLSPAKPGPPDRAVAAQSAPPFPPGLLAARELIRQERYTDALSALEALTNEQRRDPDAQLLHAVSLINCGQVEEAERLCHEVLAGDDLNAEARYLLALCLEHAGNYEAAMEQDQTAIYLDERFAMPHLHLGLLNKRLGNPEAARAAFRQASALLPREDASRVLLFGGGFSRETLLRLCEAELRASGGGT